MRIETSELFLLKAYWELPVNVYNFIYYRKLCTEMDRKTATDIQIYVTYSTGPEIRFWITVKLISQEYPFWCVSFAYFRLLLLHSTPLFFLDLALHLYFMEGNRIFAVIIISMESYKIHASER